MIEHQTTYLKRNPENELQETITEIKEDLKQNSDDITKLKEKAIDFSKLNNITENTNLNHLNNGKGKLYINGIEYSFSKVGNNIKITDKYNNDLKNGVQYINDTEITQITNTTSNKLMISDGRTFNGLLYYD